MTLCANGFPLERRGLSAEQQAKVHDFKRLLQQSGAWDDGCFDDHDCARFLKARNYDMQAAKQMWDSMLAWRKENRVDTIRDWFVFHERREYDRVFPTGLHKTDKEGHPVLIQQLGRVNIGALYKVTTDERIRLAHIAENEHLRRVVFPACSRAAGRPIDQLFTIIDLEGVAFTSMMRTTSLLKMFMAMDSNNYPETLAHMCIINAPGWFSTSWGAVKSVLSGDTVRKIEILGKDYQTALLRHIPRANLLLEYGGLSRGGVTDNEGPWLEELLPEPPAPPPPEPLLPPPQLLLQQQQFPGGAATVHVAAVAGVIMDVPAPAAAAAAGADTGEIAGGGDQRTERDVLTRRSPSPVRPGAKAAAGVAPVAGGHPPPPASPPMPKRPHHAGVQLQPRQASALSQAGPQPQLQLGPGSSSPAPSVSDSDSAQSMAAPLMSNFLPSSESSSPQHHPQQHQPLPQHRQQQAPPLARNSPPQQLSSGGGAGGLVAEFVASFQAAVVRHVAPHHQHPQQQGAGGAPAAADGGVLRPPAGPQTPLHNSHPHSQQQTPLHQHQQHSQLPLARGAGSAVGPAQLLLSSPREDATGPGTMLSAISVVYSPPSLLSPLSPADMQPLVDTATSRRTDGSGSLGPASAATSLLSSAAATTAAGSAGAMGRGSGGVNVSAGGAAGSADFTNLAAVPSGRAPSITASSGVSAFSSAIMASGELLPTAASGVGAVAGTAASGPQPHQQSQPLQQQSQNDTDDAESVRMSVMSQRSFYSALSHLDQSSCSSIHSPNEASDNARRWSVQRELHAAAIASAVAATAERRAAAAAAAGGGSLTKASLSGPSNPAPTVGIPPAGALSGVSYIVPPAANQAFGSYLDQPPPYGALRAADGSSSFTNTDGPAPAPEADEDMSMSGDDATHGSVATAGDGIGGPGHRGRGAAAQTVDAVAIQMGNDNNGGGSNGGMSRSPSAAAMEECSLGAGAVRWARGWFFRRRNYGRLVDDGGEGGGIGGGSGQGLDGGRQGAMMIGRGKGGGVGQYAMVQDGPLATSPSKIVPKMPAGVHHSRGDSWEWDQPSPYDIDQTYGRGVGVGSGGGMIHREASFGRGAERRRLLRSESPGRRRRLEDYCSCMPCCTIM